MTDYARYAAEAGYWMRLHQMVAQADAEARTWRRVDRLPAAWPEEVWERVPVVSVHPVTGTVSRSWGRRARS